MFKQRVECWHASTDHANIHLDAGPIPEWNAIPRDIVRVCERVKSFKTKDAHNGDAVQALVMGLIPGQLCHSQYSNTQHDRDLQLLLPMQVEP
jgi:hypothetical protein